MNRSTVQLAILACVIGGIALLVILLRAEPGPGGAGSVPAIPISANADEPQSGRPKIEQGSKRAVGSFEVGNGRTIRMSTAATIDGMGCLIEEEEQSFASSCLEGGLFSKRRVEIMVSSMGGPDRFDELRVVGVAAPNVAAVQLVKSDGTKLSLMLNPQRAFVFESTAADLAARIVPTSLVAIGKNGRVIDRLDFPVGS